MPSDKQWIDKFYKDLKVLEGNSFPKTCAVCGKAYANLKDFLDNTEPVPKSSGLIKTLRDKQGQKIGLFRNCACHSTLMVQCGDRRATSPGKTNSRKTFGRLLNMLTTHGMETDTARSVLLKLLNGQDTKELKSLGISVKHQS